MDLADSLVAHPYPPISNRATDPGLLRGNARQFKKKSGQVKRKAQCAHCRWWCVIILIVAIMVAGPWLLMVCGCLRGY